MNPDCLLKFENVRFGYPDANGLVLTGFNLEIGAGTVTAILGPNGAGKTTILNLSLGWLKPQAGNIYLDRKNLKEYSRRALGQWIGLVPQSEHIPFEYNLSCLGAHPTSPPWPCRVRKILR
jgi:ABC-type cobalamin/Fe3+-siderophores transport system ATPase subunit